MGYKLKKIPIDDGKILPSSNSVSQSYLSRRNLYLDDLRNLAGYQEKMREKLSYKSMSTRQAGHGCYSSAGPSMALASL